MCDTGKEKKATSKKILSVNATHGEKKTFLCGWTKPFI